MEVSLWIYRHEADVQHYRNEKGHSLQNRAEMEIKITIKS